MSDKPKIPRQASDPYELSQTKDDAMVGAMDRLAAALERIAELAEKQEKNRPLRKDQR